MKNEDRLQLELFTSEKEDGQLNSQASKNSLLSLIWNYEKTILIIIGFIVIGIISFSLGVEKGKRIAASKNNTYIDIALKTAPQKVNKPVAAEPAAVQYKPVTQKESTLPKQQSKEELSNYTVQVASYKSKTSAEKEIEDLKKKGLTPVTLYKGDFVVVCVGNFPDKARAKSLLSELKKQRRFADCLIRRL